MRMECYKILNYKEDWMECLHLVGHPWNYQAVSRPQNDQLPQHPEV